MNAVLRQAKSPAPESLDDFDAVYEAFYQEVYRAVRAIVLDPAISEDVTQNTFLKAYRKRDQFRPIGSLGGWLHTIAIREAISTLRWRRLHDQLLGAIRLKAALPPADQSLGGLLSQLLEELGPGTRAALVLHYYHGYRQREIAGILRIPEGTVATRIANGLKKMRVILDRQ
ncbi:MAG: RNA polymerase sigma factor [Candidatus Dormibacteraceae bacterium]